MVWNTLSYKTIFDFCHGGMMWWEDKTLAARAAPVRLVAFDVDGVCTDGRFYYGPEGEALHAFHARDGMGLVLARQNGLPTAAISGRKSSNVQARLGELGVPHILQGIKDKPAQLDELRQHYNCQWAEVAFVGDDVNDIQLLQHVGLAATVADAAFGISDHAHCTLQAAGGRGALRELLEGILRVQGRWPY
jgi:3-deoxy-D-manno-octulosonate 8-phosphate phosphatase (KDO 8-P phosphatase)